MPVFSKSVKQNEIVDFPNFEHIVEAVELDVLVALGGDADGDAAIGLSDWGTLRANFGRNGTDWTDGNFDPWGNDEVGLADWGMLRANFEDRSRLVGERSSESSSAAP